jgi:hypothetical protein
VSVESSAKKGTDKRGEAARKLLQQIPLSANQTVILARGPQLLAHRGELKLTEALDIAVYVANGWKEQGQQARVQFMRLPIMPNERLLYTRRLRGDFLLTFVDAADAPLPRLSQLANQFMALLESSSRNGYN